MDWIRETTQSPRNMSSGFRGSPKEGAPINRMLYQETPGSEPPSRIRQEVRALYIKPRRSFGALRGGQKCIPNN